MRDVTEQGRQRARRDPGSHAVVVQQRAPQASPRRERRRMVQHRPRLPSRLPPKQATAALKTLTTGIPSRQGDSVHLGLRGKHACPQTASVGRGFRGSPLSCIASLGLPAMGRWNVHDEGDASQAVPPPGGYDDQTCPQDRRRPAYDSGRRRRSRPTQIPIPSFGFHPPPPEPVKAPPGYTHFHEGISPDDVSATDDRKLRASHRGVPILHAAANTGRASVPDGWRRPLGGRELRVHPGSVHGPAADLRSTR